MLELRHLTGNLRPVAPSRVPSAIAALEFLKDVEDGRAIVSRTEKPQWPSPYDPQRRP